MRKPTTIWERVDDNGVRYLTTLHLSEDLLWTVKQRRLRSLRIAILPPLPPLATDANADADTVVDAYQVELRVEYQLKNDTILGVYFFPATTYDRDLLKKHQEKLREYDAVA